jgi:uncharacterized protein
MAEITARPVDQARAGAAETEFLWKTYRWMSMGLALTGAIAWIVAGSPQLTALVLGNRIVFYGLMLAELGMVVFFSAKASSMTFGSAAALFLGYSALNGLTMSIIFMIYTASSVAQVFFVTAGSFAGLSLYGATTKRDLTAMGQFMVIGLIGIIVASLVNIFLASPAVYWITTYAGVLVFAGLTAYDNQKLRRLYAAQGEAGNLALQGALTLYLDFINLLLMLLRIFGKRR